MSLRIVSPRVMSLFVEVREPFKVVVPAVWVMPLVKAQAVVEPFSVTVSVVLNVVAGVNAQPFVKLMLPASPVSEYAVLTVTRPLNVAVVF